MPKSIEWPELLISTTFNIFHLKDNKFRSLLDKNFTDHYYGITWSDEKLYIATTRAVFETGNDFNFKEIKNYEKVCDIHQILYLDKKIYITNTLENTIDALDTTTFNIDKKEWIRQRKDIEHINSIHNHDGKFYVCCHNHGDSFIKLFDENFQELGRMTNIGRMNHNIIVNNNLLYTLSSHSCEFIKLDMSNLTQISRKVFTLKDKTSHYFLRGLAHGDGYFIVGMTCNRSASGRDNNPSWLFMYDNDLKLLDKKTLPHPGQIREVRTLNKNYSHNNLKFPLKL